MKHPSPEEWIEFVNDESSPETRAKLEAHLQECEVCAGEIESWRQVITTLPAWKVPEPAKILRPYFGFARWGLAAAAAFVAGLAVVASVALAGLSADVRALRAEVAARSKTGPTNEETSRLAAEVAGMRVTLADLTQAYARSTNDLQRALFAVGEVNRFNRDALLELASTEKTARDQEHASVIQALLESESRQQARLTLLRKDLETVASMADDQIQLTRQNLIRISATSKTNFH